MRLENWYVLMKLSTVDCKPLSKLSRRGTLLQHSALCNQAFSRLYDQAGWCRVRKWFGAGSFDNVPRLGRARATRKLDDVQSRRPLPRLSRTSSDDLRERQWIRRSSLNSSASFSHTEQRNAWPAELDRRSRARVFPNFNAEGGPHGWVRGRPAERADGHRGRMLSRKKGQRSLRDIRWSRQTCCGVGRSDHGE